MKNLNFIYQKQFFLLLIILLATALSNTAFAQNNNKNTLILSDLYSGHYLSPYINKIRDPSSSFTVGNIMYQHSNDPKVDKDIGSINTLGIDGGTTWVSFNVMNRSASNYWRVDLGKAMIGRFGLLSNVEVYISNKTGTSIKKVKVTNKQVSSIPVPINEQSIIIMKLTQELGQAVAIPLRIINEKEYRATYEIEKNILYFILMIIAGAACLLIGIFVIKPARSYLFLSLFYVAMALLTFIQNTYITTDIAMFGLGNIAMPASFSIACVFGLLGAYFFWNLDETSKVIKIVVFGAIGITIVSLLLSLFIFNSSANTRALILFGSAIALVAITTVFSFLETQQGNIETPYFTFAWAIFLGGIIISMSAVLGIIPAVPVTINAYLYALVFQTLLMIWAVKANLYIEDNDVTLSSKTINIKDNSNISKLRQSKENAEQDRLLRVIEQERKILGELRKSEARRTEEMRLAKEQADEANRGKSAFLAVVSHEIRTPMTGIMGMVKLLMNTKLSKEQKDCAITIQDSSEAMLALLNDILDFEKIERGKMDFEELNVDIHRLIKGVATLMNGHAAQKGIELRTKIGDTLPQYVVADPTRLRQVLLNLTGNSIKFTPEGHVTLTAELIKEERQANGKSSCEIYFGISDSGIGISEEAQKNLFEAFSQADSSISRKFGGTGLGLAISKGLVEAMGSSINLSSNEGEGSTFFFTINLDKGTGNPVIEEQEEEIDNESVPALSVLLVEDNEINRKVVIGFLRDTNHKIDIAIDAESALEQIETENYDLVLMDIELPGMNGDEATIQIRKSTNPDIASLPVIALTGNTMDNEVKRFYKAGMNDIVEKPIDQDKLISTLTDAAYKKFSNPETTLPSQEEEIVDDSLTIIDTKESVIATTPPENKTVPSKENETVSASGAILKSKATTEIEKNEVVTPMAQYLSSLSSTPEKPVALVAGDAEPDQAAPAAVEQKPKKKMNLNSSAEISQAELPQQTQPTAIVENPEFPVFKAETLDALKEHLGKEELQDMLRDTITKSEEIINDLTQAYKNNDMEAVAARGHELKGMTGNFGLMEICHYSGEIEKAVKTNGTANIESLINNLPEMKKRAETALNQWVDS